MIDKEFWFGKKVFITGHTGFKGSWLCLWLHSLGAEVTGYSLCPPTEVNLFEIANVNNCVKTIIGDVRDKILFQQSLRKADPDIIFHMAAQPLVRESYQNPVFTYETNVMGTIHLFEAIRSIERKKKIAVINITTDKCYENREWPWGYREHDPMGGFDPYSNSKACSELITASYRQSFFNQDTFSEHGVSLASARAGNVIGGGDWATDRLIPDSIRSLLKGEKIKVRNPHSIRPWQHVLEPLGGYMVLAQKLYGQGISYAEGWNFGPNTEGAKTVEWIVKRLCEKWGPDAEYEIYPSDGNHEAHFLKLDCSKAEFKLGWESKWDINIALDKVIEWTLSYAKNKDMQKICLQQIHEYERTVDVDY